jgi:hypothetical protein
MASRPPLDDHPLVRALDGVAELLDDVAALDPTYAPTREKMRSLRTVDRLIARLEGFRLDLLAASSDVAADAGARSAGVWLALESRRGAAAGARDQHDAELLARRPAVLAALRDGVVNAAQAASSCALSTRCPATWSRSWWRSGVAAARRCRALRAAGAAGAREASLRGDRAGRC